MCALRLYVLDKLFRLRNLALGVSGWARSGECLTYPLLEF
jgi:hypothetical protein